jgi:glycosyltransferase involved in cell wall biosynthesis
MLPHLDAARARGWQVDVACNVTRDPEITKERCDQLYSVPFVRNPLHPKNLLATAQLIQLIRREKYDIVHCHNPSGGFYGRLAATLAGTKPIRLYTAHGFHFHPLGGKMLNLIYRIVEKIAGKFLSDAVLTINQWDFEQAQRIIPSQKVYFTHGVGVSTDELDPKHISDARRKAIRTEFGVHGDGYLVTCIGEMIPRKRHHDILDAISTWEFQSAAPKNLVFAFIGDGPLKKSLMEQLRIPYTLQFPGFRRDILDILAASDVFVFPSVQEGLPCSVQEALSMEVPVVAYEIRGCADMVDDSCGRLVKSPGARGLGEAMTALLTLSPEERMALGRAGRKKMIEQYDRPKCVAQVLEIYDELLERLE